MAPHPCCEVVLAFFLYFSVHGCISKEFERFEPTQVREFVSKIDSDPIWSKVADELFSNQIDGKTLLQLEDVDLQEAGMPMEIAKSLMRAVKVRSGERTAQSKAEKREMQKQNLKQRRDALRSRVSPRSPAIPWAARQKKFIELDPEGVRAFVIAVGFGRPDWRKYGDDFRSAGVTGKIMSEFTYQSLVEIGMSTTHASMLVEAIERRISKDTAGKNDKDAKTATDSSSDIDLPQPSSNSLLSRLRQRRISHVSQRISNESYSISESRKFLNDSSSFLGESQNILITCPNKSVFEPVNSVKMLNFSLPKKIRTPTPVQRYSWAVACRGRDMIATAETGSGKTLAYLVPLVSHLLKKPLHDTPGICRPHAVVVLPTRELALQVLEVAQPLLLEKNRVPGLLIGGSRVNRQIGLLKSGAEALIVTPGRALDVVKNYTGVDLSQVDFVVLDEADKLLSMGFQEEVMEVLGLFSNLRQTLLLSATWPAALDTFASSVLKNPVRVAVKQYKSHDIPEAASSIEQVVRVCAPDSRATLLLEILKEIKNGEKCRVLVFTKTKKAVEYILELLNVMGYKSVLRMHGEMSQEDRVKSFGQFRKDRDSILVATDLAARGLDIENVAAVINYEMPQTIEQYVHRIGRTGRAGRYGIAYTLFTKDDLMLSDKLVTILLRARAHVPPELFKIAQSSRKTRKERAARNKQRKKEKALQKAISKAPE